MITFTPENFRQKFPLIQETLNSNEKIKQPIIYFDNAATTQKNSSSYCKACSIL
jgi:selenocysteine lyase/cysteine desulfurase